MIDRQYVEPKELRQVATHLERNAVYYVAGSSSVYVPSYSCKYIDKFQCRPWTDLNGQSLDMPPGEAARTELKREWPTLKRVGWNKRHVVLFDKRPPMHYQGPYQGQATYVDLSSAYHQIYSKIWLDVCWPRGIGGRLPLHDVADRLSVWKAARNAIVGISRSRTAVSVRGRVRKTLHIENHYLSPALWATVMDVLHWVAREALEEGAIYVNTDGYMFPGKVGYTDGFLLFLIDHGLDFKIKATGEADIVSWNNYRLGQTRTQLYKLKLDSSKKEFSNVAKHIPQWGEWWSRIHRLSGSRTGKDNPEREEEGHTPKIGLGNVNLQHDSRRAEAHPE